MAKQGKANPMDIDDPRDDFVRGFAAGAGVNPNAKPLPKKGWFLLFLPFILLFTIGSQVYDIWWSIFPR